MRMWQAHDHLALIVYRSFWAMQRHEARIRHCGHGGGALGINSKRI